MSLFRIFSFCTAPASGFLLFSVRSFRETVDSFSTLPFLLLLFSYLLSYTVMNLFKDNAMKKPTKDLKNYDYFLEAYTAGVSASAVLIKGATITTPIYARIPLFRRAERRQRCDCRRCHRLYGTYRLQQKRGDSKIITLNPTVHPTIHTALHKQAYYPHTVLLRTHSAVSSPTDSVQTEMPASPRQNRRTARQAANHTTIPLLNLTPD